MTTGRIVFAGAAIVGLVLTVVRPTPPSTPAAVVPEPPEAPVDVPAQLHAAALLDEARMLTPTEVALSEDARERWLPLLGELHDMATDPSTDAIARERLVATLARLEQVGL